MSIPTDEIFVQIASYRDPDLQPTVADCIAKAAHPDRLTFGICWQHEPDESIDEILGDPRMRVISVPFNRARGPCWARSQLQQLYDGEEYTLQLDAHHRFVEGWDEILVEMLEALRADGHDKPLLTSYAPHFDPDTDPDSWPQEPLKLGFARFLPEGSIFIRPAHMTDHDSLDAPIPARFYSAHFAFTLGQFAHEVPHDPELYFTGEEPMISVRAFTHGYDLFHPHRVVLWHYYTRRGEPRHWEDDPRWSALNALSYRRQRRLLGMEPGGPEPGADPCGLGTERSLAEYEAFAGIEFAHRRIQQYALDMGNPPAPPPLDSHWVSGIKDYYQFAIHLEASELPTDPEVDFWFVGAHDEAGVELFREDLRDAALVEFLAQPVHERVFSFEARSRPASWTVWPHSAADGWLEKITRPIDQVTHLEAENVRDTLGVDSVEALEVDG